MDGRVLQVSESRGGSSGGRGRVIDAEWKDVGWNRSPETLGVCVCVEGRTGIGPPLPPVGAVSSWLVYR